MPQIFASNFGSSSDGSVAVLTLPDHRLRLLRPHQAPVSVSSPLASSSSGRLHVHKYIDFEECVHEDFATSGISGDVFTVCVSPYFVCLVHGEPAALESTAILLDPSSDKGTAFTSKKNIAGQGKENKMVETSFGHTSPLTLVSNFSATRKVFLGNGSFVARMDSDEKSVFFFETFSQSLKRWTPLTGAFDTLWRPSPPSPGRAGAERFLSSFSVLCPSHVFALTSRHAVSGEYSLHIRSWDRSLERRIPLRGPSIVTCHPRSPTVLVSLVGAVMPRHPLVEAIESGVATLLVFGRGPSSKGGSAHWSLLSGGSSLFGDDSNEGTEKSLRTLTFLTFGLVGFSLMWTLWALFYWGWWMRID
jgi:hypothetical protein